MKPESPSTLPKIVETREISKFGSKESHGQSKHGENPIFSKKIRVRLAAQSGIVVES